MSKNKWLQEGQQTKISKKIKKIAKSLRGDNSLEIIFNILFWIRKNLKFVKSWKWREKYLCRRTADQIIESKKSSGCSDKAIVFISLARGNNIPSRYVNVIDLDWLRAGKPKFVSNHIFVDVYISKKWYKIDPTNGTINIGYFWPTDKKFVLYKKALDSWDMDIRGYGDLEKSMAAFKDKWLKYKNKIR
jgi:transglutaminase-like putative cysteine protease